MAPSTCLLVDSHCYMLNFRDYKKRRHCLWKLTPTPASSFRGPVSAAVKSCQTLPRYRRIPHRSRQKKRWRRRPGKIFEQLPASEYISWAFKVKHEVRTALKELQAINGLSKRNGLRDVVLGGAPRVEHHQMRNSPNWAERQAERKAAEVQEAQPEQAWACVAMQSKPAVLKAGRPGRGVRLG